jgi:hypothetical protein
MRLVKGAGVLGRLWREGGRCDSGWTGFCRCSPKTDFCRAKTRWVSLLLDLHLGWPYDLTGEEEFAVVEAMTVTAFTASGLTAAVEVPGARRPLRFGRNGTIWKTLVDLAIANDPTAVEAVVKVQECF